MALGKRMAHFIDIGANLVDTMYQGVYHGSKKHEPDLEHVLKRAWDSGLQKIIITGTSLEDSKSSLEIANKHENLVCSVGCHPTNCNEFEKSPNADEHMKKFVELIKNNSKKVVALGEFGLDYDRLHFCPKEIQLKWFEAQLIALAPLGLPLFLHCRNAAEDFMELLQRHEPLWSKGGGVVHSFDGTKEQAEEFLKLGLYIGINGCSLKTKENLEVVKTLPNDRLMIETDSPWCDIRPTHAGASLVTSQLVYPSVKKEKWKPDAMVKGRNEPCSIRHVLEIVAGVKGENVETLGQTIYDNTLRLFFPNSQ